MSSLHPVVARAAKGEPPEWAAVGEGRRTHLVSVAYCLERWARALDLDDEEVTRWRAAGFLHDALRDADPAGFDPAVAPDWPPKLRHGPAAAARLTDDGVEDSELLTAVAYHTTGHPEFGRLGRFLYLADYLEPGRPYRPAWRAALRARLPEKAGDVLREVALERITRALDRGGPLLRETVEFWNRVVRMGGGG